MILINLLSFKKTLFFIIFSMILLLLLLFNYTNGKHKDISYRLSFGIKVIEKSDTLYNELNKFKKENKLSANDIYKMISYLNVKNAFLRYDFKGSGYINNNILILYDKYLINKSKPITLNNDDIFIVRNNSEILLQKNISNICSLHIIGYKDTHIIHMNTFDSFGIYLPNPDDIKDSSMICEYDKEWDIGIKSSQSADIDEKYLNSTHQLIGVINRIKHKNGFNTHQISSMIMSSDIKFVPIIYKKIYDDNNIVIDKTNNIIYSKNNSENKIKLAKNSFLILYQDKYGKLGHIGEIDSIDAEHMIVIKKQQATYIYDDHLSKLRVNLITD